VVNSVIRIRRRIFAVAASSFVAAVLIPAASASAETPTIFDTCSTGDVSQALLAYGDQNYYSLAPGGDFEDPSMPGWQLSGGASIVSTDRNGQTTNVLDLPSGSKAVSPNVCVTRDYPTARAWVRNVKGSEGVFFYVSYVGTSTWDKPKNTGQIHGPGNSWGLATPVNLQPYGVDGWMQARITLIPGGKTSEFQVDDLNIDPKLRR
jgi:hypothetical protein